MEHRVCLFLALAACGSVADKSNSDASIDAGNQDGQSGSDADIDAPGGLRPWGTPIKLGVVNDPANGTGDASITPDLLTLMFRSVRPGGVGAGDIYTSHRSSATAAWPAPTLVTELDSTMDEAHPWIAPDGLRIYFSSKRTGGPGDFDLYTSVRANTTSAWGTPVLMSDLSGVSSDLEIALASGGLIGVLTSSRGGTRAPYLVSRTTTAGAFTSIQAIATGTGCDDSALANGGLSLYCSHDDALWMATRPDLSSDFGTPVSVLTGTSLSDPWISDDQNTALITLVDDTTVGGIYMVTREP
ncbi:MAG TPA: hypothetical protein VGM90_20415 [Kofleriaceae bacterium]|jgi:hypothetical protein